MSDKVATNGCQIGFIAPQGAGKIRISGQNQNGQQSQWDGSADPNSDGFTVPTVTTDWWWKGKVNVWYNDSSGQTHLVTANIPSFSPSDTWVFAYNDTNGSSGR